MAILAILATLTAPSLVSVFRGTSLNQGGQLIQDQLKFYRQYAVVNNCTVEVRFLKFIDSSISGDTGHYRAIQGLKVSQVVNQTTGAITYTKTPISKPLRVPPSIIIDAGSGANAGLNISYLIYYIGKTSSFYANNLGSAIAAPQTPVAGTDPSIFNVGTTYTYVAFQFRPDGSTTLDQITSIIGTWGCFLTLHQLSSGDPVAKTALPKNYYTIQIDPNNGHVNSYRP